MDPENTNNQQPETILNQPIITPVPPVPQPKSKLPIILGILVLLGIVVGLGMVGGKYFSSPKTPTIAEPIPTIILTPTPIFYTNASKYERCSKYTNTTLNLSFICPQGWYLKDDSNNIEPELRLQNYDPALDENYRLINRKGEYVIFVFEREMLQKAKTPEELKLALEEERKGFGQPTTVLDEKTTKINSYQILYQKTETLSADGSSPYQLMEMYIFRPSGGILSFILDVDIEGGKKYLDQILSTFRFTP